ncbi:NAD-dependent epimerase/dehydratase family protein [Arcicella rigui]|uniref:Epimerase n=1 Tax=Arcicella rigui TaxID=797020 RepID=A0ABU5Q4V5_9BACT|nr:NAD-dependent epimerase/dehydratase family protein [Arcicella rigui]MEA5137868.1 epimerase [Arcicella rigui]
MKQRTIKVIVTGATGMVGEGVLHECLLHDSVEEVLVINRKPCGVSHPKLKEIIHQDFYDFTAVKSQLTGYDACFFCLGVTSVGKKEPEYTKLTYTLTLGFATILSQQNTDMTFCYVSGASTDSTEKGKSMWARVKGKTENDLMKLPFKQVFAFRPGYIHPTKGLKNTLSFYTYIGWMYPILKRFFPNSASTLQQVGLAMINVTLNGYQQKIIEVKDINQLGNLDF